MNKHHVFLLSISMMAAVAFPTGAAMADGYKPVFADYSTLCTPQAFEDFVRKASDSSYTPENRVIMLREAMDHAQTLKQRREVLEQIGKTGAFQGMVYAASWLDNPDLNKDAARAVLSIALAHNEYAGPATQDAVRRAAALCGRQQDADAFLKAAANGGWKSLFNGRTLAGWKGLVDDPIKRAAVSPDELAKKQAEADVRMRHDWKVINGCITYVGHGYDNLCTVQQYGDFEMLVDWKLDPSGAEPDAGIYLRGTPQVQIWDTTRTEVGAQVGSGGLYNNQKNPSKPSIVADNQLGQWNTFRIIMRGEKVTVYLNGVKVVDNVTLENYWDRSRPIFPREQIELQAHGSLTYFRNIYVREL